MRHDNNYYGGPSMQNRSPLFKTLSCALQGGVGYLESWCNPFFVKSTAGNISDASGRINRNKFEIVAITSNVAGYCIGMAINIANLLQDPSDKWSYAPALLTGIVWGRNYVMDRREAERKEMELRQLQ